MHYRESYGIYACNGILFNHESPRCGETFVTRKITRGLANIAQGLDDCLYIGNMDSLRDWGHAHDYVRMQWLMLQQGKPEDFVIASGVQISVREFITRSAQRLGITIGFEGKGVDEVGVALKVAGDTAPAAVPGSVIDRVDPRYFRPTEVEALLGDASRAREKLGWVPEISLGRLIDEKWWLTMSVRPGSGRCSSGTASRYRCQWNRPEQRGSKPRRVQEALKCGKRIEDSRPEESDDADEVRTCLVAVARCRRAEA